MELLLTVVQEHHKLQKENRILQKQLERSENNRVRLEVDNEKKEFLLRKVIRELSESKQTLQFKSDRLETTAIELQQVQLEIERARQIADAANQAKSEFLANMSHELRTPLNGILGYAQILSRADLPAKEQHGIDIIRQCGSHLLSLIDDVLDLSKIEARKLDLDPQPIHLRSFLQGVAEICRIRAEQKEIDFICQFDPLLPTGVVTDQKRLRQVLINLLGNAVKFTDPLKEGLRQRGSVTFRVKLLEARSDSAWAQICFQVVDTGVGIATDAIPQIFRSFEQVGEKQRQSEGTGLGLTICQSIVRLMGDEIQVESQLGVGSVFAFTLGLPLAHNWAQQHSLRHGRKIIGYEGRSLHVLVVDRHWEDRSVLVNLLESLGFTVTEAANGREGWEQICRSRFDLVITDLFMPVMDGFELLQQLRSDERFKHLKAIVSSASVTQIDRQRSLNAGGDDFLSKPIQVEECLTLLAKQLQLTWKYAEAELSPHRPISHAPDGLRLMPPSATDLQILLELARDGMLKKLAATAEQMARQNDLTQPFVDRLLEFTKHFQVERAEEFIQTYISCQGE